MESRNTLTGHMDDLARRAKAVGCAASRFLTPAEANGVANLFAQRSGVVLTFDGGFDGAERVRAVFADPERGAFDRDELFAALRISHRSQDEVGHRDILGSVMALGIERATVGDIVVSSNEPSATLVCLPEISGYAIENLTKIGRIGVTITQISIAELPAHEENLKYKTDTVASLRLDAVLSAAFGLSRTKAAELIAAERVSVNHELCAQPTKEMSEGALLSVRGIGRVKLSEVGGVSRKGRIFIKLGSYKN